MAKVAVELNRALERRSIDGAPGGLTARALARGHGWTAEDVICTSGPDDRTFEEQHEMYRVVLVVAGTFECRSTPGRALLTPGSLLLGNHEQCFECGHDHASGDRCVSFGYTPEYFERLAVDAGVSGGRLDFSAVRVPPVRALAPIVSQACIGLIGREQPTSMGTPWQELSIQAAVLAIQLARDLPLSAAAPPFAVSRVTRLVRRIDRDPDVTLTLEHMASESGLSPYHFLRAFREVTGVTPHQYVLRARLREAAVRVAAEPAKVLDIALDCGFGDVSNFNHAFRAEFGVSPRAYRRAV